MALTSSLEDGAANRSIPMTIACNTDIQLKWMDIGELLARTSPSSPSNVPDLQKELESLGGLSKRTWKVEVGARRQLRISTVTDGFA